MMDKLNEARQLVRQQSLPKALRKLSRDEDWLPYFDGRGTSYLTNDVTPDVLARSLHYLIKIKLTGLRDESDAPLGVSKYKGLPHLPPDVDWPRGRYFLVQFNLADIHRLDLYDAFPASGMFYIFFDPGEGEAEVIHYEGPLDRLRVVPYPDSASRFNGAKYYLEGFRRRSSLMEFRPRCAFYLGSDAYDLSTARELIPKSLRSQVADILGGRVAARDVDRRIFGRPLYWQGEDDRDDDDSDEKRHLLFQDEFGEGHIHVWIEDDDARRRDYSQCWLDYSGT